MTSESATEESAICLSPPAHSPVRNQQRYRLPGCETVPTDSGTGSRNPGTSPTGIRTGTSSEISGTGPTGTGTGSAKVDRVPVVLSPSSNNQNKWDLNTGESQNKWDLDHRVKA